MAVVGLDTYYNSTAELDVTGKEAVTTPTLTVIQPKTAGWVYLFIGLLIVAGYLYYKRRKK